MRDFSETHVNAGGPSMVPYVSLLWRSLLSDVTEKLSKSFERTQPIFSRVCAVCFAVWVCHCFFCLFLM